MWDRSWIFSSLESLTKFLIVTNGAFMQVPQAHRCPFSSSSSPRSFPNTILPSEDRICKILVHLQRRHLHIRRLRVLQPSCRTVSSWSSHGTKSCCGATHVGKPRRSRNTGTVVEPAWCHQVPIALRMRESVAWTAGTGAADACMSRRRGRCCLFLSHLEHHLKI